MIITEKRLKRIKEVVAARQLNLTVVLEDIHDTHNVSAVVRTCDSVGIQEIFVLFREKRHGKFKLGKRSSSGARKWIDLHYYEDPDACFAAVRARYDRVLSAALTEEATSLYAQKLTGSVALVFGNEHAGVHPETLALSDGVFAIPQFGMVQSLNISVACAVTLYEATRQRIAAGLYAHPAHSSEEAEALLGQYLDKHEQRFYRSYEGRRIGKPKKD